MVECKVFCAPRNKSHSQKDAQYIGETTNEPGERE